MSDAEADLGAEEPAGDFGSDGPLGADTEETTAAEGDEESPTKLEADNLEADDLEAEEGKETSAEVERDRYFDALQRLQADFENYRKRVARQQSELYERAAEGLVTKLLPVLDTADLAVAHSAGDEVAQVRTSLLDTLVKAGLERIAPEDGPFDPNLHEAVAHDPASGGPDDGGEPEVVELFRAGYAWNGRVLRPAMVKVKG